MEVLVGHTYLMINSQRVDIMEWHVITMVTHWILLRMLGLTTILKTDTHTTQIQHHGKNKKLT